MAEYLTIGSCPAEEECAQVGAHDYRKQAFIEMRAFINQIRRVLGNEPEGAALSIKSFEHDFGTYHEVVCKFDPNDNVSTDYAFKVEAEAPGTWDNAAKDEMDKAGYVWPYREED